MDFAEKFQKTCPQPGQLLVAWMGQAGFLIKNSQKKTLVLDTYLSDLAWRLDQNKRLTPPPCSAEELSANVVLASHHHTDHLDLDTIPVFLEQGARLYCSSKSYELCGAWGLDVSRITPVSCGTIIEDSGFRVEAVFAEHGDYAADAVGFLIDAEGLRIYFTGDTSYSRKRMQAALKAPIDLLLLPINGEYGNMNERDAAMLAGQVKARVTVPCHFWTFARHKGSPHEFCLEMKESAPESLCYLMAQGELVTMSKDGIL